MADPNDIEFICELLDTYTVEAWRMSVAADDPDDAGVPIEMQVGEINADGWVEWHVLPSTVTDADISALETEFDTVFPPLYRAYLQARLHLFDQVQSRRFDQQILLPEMPAGRPLEPLRDLMNTWQPLFDAGFVPVAQWGDGWGPICFDTTQRRDDGECPMVWIDHEDIISLDPGEYRQPDAVRLLMKPLYDSCRDFFSDIFGGN